MLTLHTASVRRRLDRQEHAVCLRLAASYRVRISRGERGLRPQHAWALDRARTLRERLAPTPPA